MRRFLSPIKSLTRSVTEAKPNGNDAPRSPKTSYGFDVRLSAQIGREAAVFLVRWAHEAGDALPALKAATGGLVFILDHCGVNIFLNFLSPQA